MCYAYLKDSSILWSGVVHRYICSYALFYITIGYVCTNIYISGSKPLFCIYIRLHWRDGKIRKVHKNFKDNGSRILVHHKTNLIDTDIYEMANTELKVICCHFDLAILLNTNVLKFKHTLKGQLKRFWYLLRIRR